MENGNKGHGFKSQLFAVLEDHLELAALEWDYEKKQSSRRFSAILAAGALVISAFVLLNIALVRALAAFGGSLGWVCVGLGVLYVLAGVLFYRYGGLRDPRVGEPFQGTRQELNRSLEWIQKHFS